MRKLVDTILVRDEELAWDIARLLETRNEAGRKYEIDMQGRTHSLERMDAKNEFGITVYEQVDLR